MRVLVISPSTAERVALAGLLRGEGHSVTAKVSREDGVREALANDFDVVIADVQLHGLDGLALLRELAEQGPPPRVILICPRANRVIRRHGVVCLPKPIDLAELYRHVEARPALEARLG